MEVISCPDPAVWQQYILGLVEEAEQQALDAHMAHCPACQKCLGRLPSEDTLTTDLRGGLTVAKEQPNPTVDQLIRAAAELGTSATWAPGRDHPRPASEAHNFLAPAQSPE